jgi:chitinase
MPRRSLALLALMLLAACASAPPAAAPPSRSFKVIGYVGARTKFESIDVTKVTHLNYAFAKVRGDEVVYFENPDAPDHLNRLRALKNLNPNLKIILSIGGWGAEWFSDAALTEEARCRFASSAIDLVKRYQLDGLDIDWEYPGQRGGGNRFRAEDKQNFTLLLALLRHELDLLGGGHTLSIASSAGRYFETTEMDRLHAYVDWFNVMTYDMSGSWDPLTGHHAPLHKTERTSRSIESYVRQHLDAGVPPAKIVVGVPFYAKEWKWVTNRKSPTGLNEAYDLFAGDVAFYKLRRDYLTAAGFTRGWDSAARAPYLWNAETGTWVSYEDEQSLAEKARFVKAYGLGGMMYWEHSQDPEQALLGAIAAELR